MTERPKFAVGDRVEFCGNAATVTKVDEYHYFYGADQAYYLYDIQYDKGGSAAQVSEAALILLYKGTVEPQKIKRLCECGAWATGSNAEHHARYCPAYNPFERKTE